MEKVITFKNIMGLDILRFENIKLMYSKDFKQIDFQLYVNFEFFTAQTSLDVEEFDFLGMKEYLKKIYNFEVKSFVFNPIGDRLDINSIYKRTGK